MKKQMNCQRILISFIVTALLTSCTTPGNGSVTRTTHDVYPPKSPQTVSWYTNQKKPGAAYRIIGVAKVPKRNMLGMARENEAMHSMMKNLAASIGGDGLIDEKSTERDMQANVIAYQKILI